MSKLYSPPHTTFHIPTGAGSTTLPIQIAAPEIQAENLPLSTWTASVVLARQLHKFKFSDRDSPDRHLDRDSIPVLELGAGTGLVGLAAACLWETGVILTDLAPIVSGLHANIALNQRLIAESGEALVECGTLDWGTPGNLTLAALAEDYDERTSVSSVVRSKRKARVILAADVIYDSDHPEMLAGVIFEWLERCAEARVCMCWPLRVAYLDEIREMWKRLEDGGLVCELEGREEWEGEKPNGDDEMLCEWSVWRWREGVLEKGGGRGEGGRNGGAVI
jgi:predicted nicotinamide N-methyase